MELTKKTKLMEVSRVIAIILFFGGLAFNITEIVYQTKFNEIGAFTIASFCLHIFFFSILVYGLIFKKDKITELGLSMLKVFDGVFYPLLSMRKVDACDWSVGYSAATTITFVIASAILLAVLIFFVLERVTNKCIYWKLILLFLLLSFVAIFVNFICAWIESTQLNIHWSFTLESGYLCFLFLGMYFACKSIVYEETPCK